MNPDTRSTNMSKKQNIKQKITRTKKNQVVENKVKTLNHKSTFIEKAETARSIKIERKTRNKSSNKYDSNLKR